MRQYVVDAFTDRVFGGNPAAVCIMDQWIDEKLMMSITKENNLSETAFVIFNYYDTDEHKLIFNTMSGKVTLYSVAELNV